MSQPTLWERVKGGSKTGFDKTWQAMDKLGAPVNRLSNKLGSEAFWPTTLDKESDKAARILKTFCKDGFYAEEETTPQDGPKQKQKVIKKIPTSVIQNAKGLAIFTTMRTGLWISGAGGSGVLVARKEDGSWSPPSGILLHTAGLGFLVGVDIYDCVIVINTTEAMQAFTRVRCTLGSEISVAAGPVGAGGILDTELHKRQAPIFTYLKSRGFYAGVQIDGSVVIERNDENERFYGQALTVQDILAGKVRHPPYEVKRLLETIRAAQGDSDVDESMMPNEAPPGDYLLEGGHVFGVPDKEDPDPYGVLALEKEGMSIKEAGTQKRASWEAFSFHPAPTSPVHNIYGRNSIERQRSSSARSSWRLSAGASNPTPRRSLPPPFLPARPTVQMSDMSTQTDGDADSDLHRTGSDASAPAKSENIPDQDKATPESASNVNGYTTPPQTPPLTTHSPAEARKDESEDDNDDDDEEEEPAHIIEQQSAATPAAAQVISKARLVTVPKREPPKLPARNPIRAGGPVVLDASPQDATPGAAESVDSEVDAAEGKLHTVRLEDNEEDDEEEEFHRPDPWAKVEETKQKDGE